MDAAQIHLAADSLWSLWQRGEVTETLPASCRPATRADGYAVQAALDRLSGNTRVGWKIAATSVAGQRHIGVEGPLAGRIFAAQVYKPGAAVSIRHNRMRVAEPEFAFRFGRTLPPRQTPYAVAEVMAAVDSLHLALELPDSRFADFAVVGGPALIADNACAHELVLGEAVRADWRSLDFARHAVHATVGTRYARDGVGANVLGDPRVALTWIVNELGAQEQAMTAGEFVTTGTCAVPLDILPGDAVTADFGTLGCIAVSVAAADERTH